MSARWVDFKELRAKLKFVDVLSRYKVQLKIKGERATGFCPLPGHKSKGEGKKHSPSFSCHLGKGVFNCFSCGKGGNLLDFACLMEGGNPDDPASLRKTALKLQDMFGLSTGKSEEDEAKPASSPESGVSAPAVVPPAVAGEPKDETAPSLPVVVNAPLDFELKYLDPKHPYLSGRGFTPETIAHFGLGYCAKGMMAERIAIPLHDAEGKLIGYAGRHVDDPKVDAENPKYLFPGTRERKGIRYEFHKSEFLYNGHAIKKPVDELIVVEGFASVWWFWQLGYINAVALMGVSCSAAQAKLIIDLVRPGGRIWLLPDADEAAMQCAKSTLYQVWPHRFICWIPLPARGKQPTDLSKEELETLFAAARRTI